MKGTIINAVGREIPKYIEGIGELKPFQGAFAYEPEGRKLAPKISKTTPKDDKMVESIRKSLELCEVKNGMTISFHHHFRNGDYLVNMVVDELAEMGIKDITIVASSLQAVHSHLIEHIKNGVVTGIQTSGIRGELGEAISRDKILENL